MNSFYVGGDILDKVFADVISEQEKRLQKTSEEVPEFDECLDQVLEKWRAAHGNMTHLMSIFESMGNLSGPVAGAIKWEKQKRTGIEPSMRESFLNGIEFVDKLADFTADYIRQKVNEDSAKNESEDNNGSDEASG